LLRREALAYARLPQGWQGGGSPRASRGRERNQRGAVTHRFALVALIAAATCAAEPARCPIEGSRTHWAADFCMAKLQTDDEIAASECIAEEIARRFQSECEAKRYYKRAMCEAAVSKKYRGGTLAECLADRSFIGATVRNGGVGGR